MTYGEDVLPKGRSNLVSGYDQFRFIPAYLDRLDVSVAFAINLPETEMISRPIVDDIWDG